MILQYPGRMIIIAIALMLLGVVIPALEVLKLLESTFLLNFGAFFSSTLGLFLGLIGLAMYSRKQKRK